MKVVGVSLEINIASSNQAVVDDPSGQIHRALAAIASHIGPLTSYSAGVVRDDNGNRIGDWHFSTETEGSDDDDSA